VDPTGTTRLIVAFEGYAGYAPKYEASLRKDEADVRAGKISPNTLYQQEGLSHPGILHDIIAMQILSTNASDVDWYYHSQDASVGDAVAKIEKLAKVKHADPSGAGKCYDSIIAVGWSWGGDTARDFVVGLGAKGVKTDLLFMIDAIPRGLGIITTLLGQKYNRPKEAIRAVNYYQENDKVLRGRKMVNADNATQVVNSPDHVTIVRDVRPEFANELSRIAARRTTYK